MMPNVKQVGQATAGQSSYINVVEIPLTSKLGDVILPMCVSRNDLSRTQPFMPKETYPGHINDTPKLKQWVLIPVIP